MAFVRWEEMGGRPGEVQEALRRAVAAYTRDTAGFKIGRTNDPHRRAAAYGDYDEFVVLYQTRTVLHADAVETDLVDFFLHADNRVGGGGGPFGEGPHYVYVAIER